jgi:hypothetical protein
MQRTASDRTYGRANNLAAERVRAHRHAHLTRLTARRCSSGIIMRTLRSLSQGSLCLITAMLVLGACSTLPRIPYAPTDEASSRVLDLSGLRRYTDEPASAFVKDTGERFGLVRSHTSLYREEGLTVRMAQASSTGGPSPAHAHASQ